MLCTIMTHLYGNRRKYDSFFSQKNVKQLLTIPIFQVCHSQNILPSAKICRSSTLHIHKNVWLQLICYQWKGNILDQLRGSMFEGKSWHLISIPYEEWCVAIKCLWYGCVFGDQLLFLLRYIFHVCKMLLLWDICMFQKNIMTGKYFIF